GAGGASLAPLVLEQLDLDVAAGDAQERDVPGRRVGDGDDLGDLALLVQPPDPQLEAELSAVEVERAVEVRDRDARVPRALDGPAHGWTILRRRERSTPRRTGEAVLRWGDGLVGRRPRGARRRAAREQLARRRRAPGSGVRGDPAAPARRPRAPAVAARGHRL